MSEFTSTAIRPAGEIRDALGRSLKVSADCDSVAITVPGLGIIHLDKTQRDEFLRLFFAADLDATQWAREHGESDA